MKIVWALAVMVAVGAGFSAAVFTGGGCTSNCGGDCQNPTVVIASPNNQELNGILTGLDVSGPACPPASSVTCLGDRVTVTCSHVLIPATQPGACDVLFVFSDRPSEILRLQFGPTVNANGSCCKGYPPLGPTRYTIPVKPTGPIYSGSPDAGTYSSDAVIVLTDAGAGGAGGTTGAAGSGGAAGAPAAMDAGAAGADGAP